MLKIAAIQTNSTDSVEHNIVQILPMIRQAFADGATLIALPENAFLMAMGRRFHEQVYTEVEHPALLACRELACTLHIWLLIGSIAIKASNERDKKYLNRSYLLSPTGEIAARYDKIHLFDVCVPGGESHQESARFSAGTQAVIANMGTSKLGLSICYDIRFPQLYRSLAQAGAEIIATPAAFTHFTGEKGGWHVLNRARAMETGCFVIAPAQCGEHTGGRKTYGHSLIVNPWGEILTEGGHEPSIISAQIDLEEVAKTRQIMPSLSHDREFTLFEGNNQ